jgi:hypothetical protein
MARTIAMVMVLAAIVAGCGERGTGAAAEANQAVALDNGAETLDASADGLAAPEGAPLDTESNAADSSAGGGNVE